MKDHLPCVPGSPKRRLLYHFYSMKVYQMGYLRRILTNVLRGLRIVYENYQRELCDLYEI